MFLLLYIFTSPKGLLIYLHITVQEGTLGDLGEGGPLGGMMVRVWGML